MRNGGSLGIGIVPAVSPEDMAPGIMGKSIALLSDQKG